MYLSCLTNVNEVSNGSTANKPISYEFLYIKYVSIINIKFAISIISTPTK